MGLVVVRTADASEAPLFAQTPAPTNKKTVQKDGFFVGVGSGWIRTARIALIARAGSLRQPAARPADTSLEEGGNLPLPYVQRKMAPSLRELARREAARRRKQHRREQAPALRLARAVQHFFQFLLTNPANRGIIILPN